MGQGTKGEPISCSKIFQRAQQAPLARNPKVCYNGGTAWGNSAGNPDPSRQCERSKPLNLFNILSQICGQGGCATDVAQTVQTTAATVASNADACASSAGNFFATLCRLFGFGC
jgi:hypothetical protein